MPIEIVISIILFLFSIIFYFFPPKKINNFYGYRTFNSMKCSENWKLTNNYASKFMIIFSFCNLIFCFATLSIKNNLFTNYFGFLLLFEFILLFYFTEKKISRNEKS